MNTKNAAGKSVGVQMFKRTAVVVGVLAAFAAVVTGVILLWSTSPGPAAVVAVSLAVAAGTCLRAAFISASRDRQVQESCNWHMAEEHMFLDGEPFSLATAGQQS